MTSRIGRRVPPVAVALSVLAAGCAPQPAPSLMPGSATPPPPSPDLRASSIEPPPSAPATAGVTASPAPTDGTASPRLVGTFAAMLEAIVADRPTVRFDLQPDRLDGTWILDGNADDGLGPSRLSVVVTPRRGDLTAHPCGDPDFRQGGPCIEQDLPDGDRLVLRDRVTAGGVTTVLAVLIHPDRSGITAESSNFMIDLDPGPIGPGPRQPPAVTRSEPLYTARQLGGLLLDVGRRLAGDDPTAS